MIQYFFLVNIDIWYRIKGQMHHHDDLGSKCAYTCHLSNKTTRKSVLLSTPQIWLMKVSKKTGLSLGMEADISGQGTNLSPILIGREWQSLPATDISQPIRSRAGSHFMPLISLDQSKLGLNFCNVSLYAQTQASCLLTFISHI